MDTFKRSKITVAGKRGGRLYLTGVTFADGDGFKIKRFGYTADAGKAHTFARATAEAIAQQLATSCVDVRIARDGETDTLVAMSEEQLEIRRKAQQANAELAREVEPFIREFLRITRR